MTTELETRLAAVLKKKAEVDSKVSVAKALLEKAQGQMNEIAAKIKERFNMTPAELDAHVKVLRPQVEAELTRLENILKGV